jgi:hypothetical protein
MSEPLPNALSIWEIAASRAFFLSTPSASTNRKPGLDITASVPDGTSPVNGGVVPLLFSFGKARYKIVIR